METFTRRIMREVHLLEKENSPIDSITTLVENEQQANTQKLSSIVRDLSPSSESLMLWTGIILGQPGTPYEGGRFKVIINLDLNYPQNPPVIRFDTPVFHPNIHFKTGEICLDLLKSAWSPTWTLQSTCIAIGLLLTDPEYSSPLNCDAANLLKCGDIRGYESLVRMYVALYASSD